MSPVVEICFTCPGHAAMAARNHRTRAGVDCVWVVDEANDPQILSAKPEGVALWAAPFDRGGNLNGWPCMEGMLAVFGHAFALGYATVIKRDSDTEILDDAQMVAAPNGELALFVNRGCIPRHRAWGAGYAIHAGALPILEEAVRGRDYSEVKVAEDLFFSWALRRVSRMLPLQACRFTFEPGWPAWAPGVVWENRMNRTGGAGGGTRFWPAWPDMSK